VTAKGTVWDPEADGSDEGVWLFRMPTISRNDRFAWLKSSIPRKAIEPSQEKEDVELTLPVLARWARAGERPSRKGATAQAGIPILQTKRKVCTPRLYIAEVEYMSTARVFRSGNSQAVRLPKQFRLKSNELA